MNRRLFNTSLAATLLGVGVHPSLAAEPKAMDGNFFSDKSIYTSDGCRPTEAAYADEACLLPSENALKNKLGNWKARITEEANRIYKSENAKIKKWNANAKKWHDFASNKNIEKNYLKIIKETNIFINQFVQYRDDYSLYGKDHWATVAETVDRGGDCEDMALLKAVALRNQGFSLEKMALVVGYVQYRGRRVAHAVLLAKVGNERYVLDNLGNEIVAAREYPIQPLYALNWSRTVIFRNKK